MAINWCKCKNGLFGHGRSELIRPEAILVQLP